MSETAVTQADYAAAQEMAVSAMVNLLETGEELGVPSELMMGQFVALFQQAAERAAGRKLGVE